MLESAWSIEFTTEQMAKAEPHFILDCGRSLKNTASHW